MIIYNVVPWSYLSPALLLRIMRDVPGVIGVKQSAGDLKLFADLMLATPKDKRIFSAVDALMYPAFALGAHGAIAAILTAAPRACVALWQAVRAAIGIVHTACTSDYFGCGTPSPATTCRPASNAPSRRRGSRPATRGRRCRRPRHARGRRSWRRSRGSARRRAA